MHAVLFLCQLIWILICLHFNSNLRQLGVINGSNRVEVEVDVEKMNQFFVTQSWPQNKLNFDIPVRLGVPEFSFTEFHCRLLNCCCR
jgi:carbohydrate-selective porin OprB